MIILFLLLGNTITFGKREHHATPTSWKRAVKVLDHLWRSNPHVQYSIFQGGFGYRLEPK